MTNTQEYYYTLQYKLSKKHTKAFNISVEIVSLLTMTLSVSNFNRRKTLLHRCKNIHVSLMRTTLRLVS